MVEVDFDEVVDVPDTPDRVALKLGRNIAADTSVCAQTYNRMNKRPVEQSKLDSRYTSVSHHQSNTPISLLDGPSPPTNGRTLRKCSTKCEDLELKPNSTEFSSDPCRAASSGGSNTDSSDLSCYARIGDLQSNNSFSLNSLNRCNGKLKMDEPSCTSARCPPREEYSRSIHSACASRFAGRKRLVRNGCISPNNIARAKETSEQKNICINDAEPVKTYVRKNTPLINIDESPLSIGRKAEDIKGKGVMSYSPAAKSSKLDGRKDNGFQKEAIHVFNGDSSDPFEDKEALGGWRNTASKKIHDHPVTESGPLRGCGEARRLQNSSSYGYPEEIAFDVLNKRQKTDRRNLDSSSRISSHSDAPFRASIMQLSDLSPTTATSRSKGVCEPLINIDEPSPQERETHIQHIRSERSCPQLEEDEKLARELQEQFYREELVFAAEVDANLARMLQYGEDVRFSASSSSLPTTVINIYSPSHRRPQPRINQRTRVPRGNQSRRPTSSRMMQLRRSFRGHSSSRMLRMPRERIFNFPVDMDVDMRMDILEAFEDAVENASNVETAAWRDFNEDDYEMLLALDDNNEEHAGASHAQINNLPLSTVQSDNNREACLICLEAMSVGEAVRHLPCMHKFHKDCIDPWLGRKTSCPVCRLSITENLPTLPGC